MKNYLIYFLSLLLLLSCTKDRLNGDREILVGIWDWMYTDMIHYCNGWAEYEYRDPVSEGANYQIEITKNGTFSFLKNGELVSKHTFKIISESIPEGGIVESNKKISIAFVLDQEKGNNIGMSGTLKEMRINFYPINSWAECEIPPSNFFKKRY